MAFCGNCGARYADGAKFCPECGAKTVDPPADEKLAQTPPSVSQDPGKDAQDNKTMAILAYILFFVPMLTGAWNTSPFVRYHTNQGTILFIVSVAWSIVQKIISSVLYAIHWRLGYYLGGLLGWVSVIFVVLCIIGIMNAVNGKKEPLPVIGVVTIIK